MGCFCQFLKKPTNILDNCRSHAKVDSQKFKIEEIEELWNSHQNCEKHPVKMEKFITWSNLNFFNSSLL